MAQQPQSPLDNAKKSIRSLNSVVEALLTNHPSRMVVARDTQSERPMKPLAAFFAAGNQTFDGIIRPLVGSIFIDLHDALDVAIRAKVQEKGGDPDGVRFPIIDRPGDLETSIQGASVDRAGPDVQRFIFGLHAYPMGDGEKIWAAARLGVNLSHRQEGAFLTYLVTVRGIKKPTGGSPIPDVVRQPAGHGAKIISRLPEEHYEVGIDIKPDEITVGLSENSPLDRLSILEAVNQSAAAVSRVLDGIWPL